MTDSSDNKNTEQNESPQAEPADTTSTNHASNDLTDAVAEAMRMLEKVQGDTEKPPATDASKPEPPASTDTEKESEPAPEPVAEQEESTEPASESEPTGDAKPPGDPAAVDTTAVKVVVDENGNTTNDLQQEAIKAMQLQAEREREAEEKAREAVESNSTFTASMKLRLDSDESGDPIIKSVPEEDLIVGRADNVTDYLPDIDLTPHGAYRLGLSRRHAIITRENDRLIVKDLNSRNGTFVNGTIIPAGGTRVIRDGDEVRFGNLAMKVTFQD